MQSLQAKLYAGIFGLGVVLVPLAQAQFTPISACPFVINSPGNYQLEADLTCAQNNGITINASNVSLKLNNHKITAGDNTGIDAVVVGYSLPRVDHVAIQGPGLITNGPGTAFAVGISLQNADYSQVSQVTILGATSIGVSAFLCNFLTVASNVIGQSKTGIGTNRTGSSVISGNDTSGNYDGISLSLGSGNTANNNTSNGNSNSGISLIGSPARVYANVTDGNGQYGIYNQTAGGQMFSNTSSVANAAFDLYDVGGCGSGGSWSNNVFFTSNLPCIH